MTAASSLISMAWWSTIHVITDRETGRGKGFEFVEMSDCQAAQAAIVGLRGYECAGRTLTVSEGKGRAPHRASRLRVGARLSAPRAYSRYAHCMHWWISAGRPQQRQVLRDHGV